jgi:hypothetical protein
MMGLSTPVFTFSETLLFTEEKNWGKDRTGLLASASRVGLFFLKKNLGGPLTPDGPPRLQ